MLLLTTTIVNNVRLLEVKRLEEEEKLVGQANTELFGLFNDLQGITSACVHCSPQPPSESVH